MYGQISDAAPAITAAVAGSNTSSMPTWGTALERDQADGGRGQPELPHEQAGGDAERERRRRRAAQPSSGSVAASATARRTPTSAT
jgi:hypothetical protein